MVFCDENRVLYPHFFVNFDPQSKICFKQIKTISKFCEKISGFLVLGSVAKYHQLYGDWGLPR